MIPVSSHFVRFLRPSTVRGMVQELCHQFPETKPEWGKSGDMIFVTVRSPDGDIVLQALRKPGSVNLITRLHKEVWEQDTKEPTQ